ncbi:MAG: 30S ribosomal protein S21 [Candidatus Pacebacteria bacterium]|jgi:ribosomal protein S21|nr:30S ribosomal protein S21 [Candidatus Parcubacteria bacterium]MCK4891772.1 30S ribosomal protein S21 [Candidatus Paceibacterota bacterium]
MIEVKKKDNESIGSLLRRFSKKVQQSGLLLQARSSRFKDKNLSRTERRKSALRRKEITSEKEKLRKLGKLEEDFRTQSRY